MTTRTATTLAEWTTCLPSTEHTLEADGGFEASVTFYGDLALLHDADETIIVSAAAGRKVLAGFRKASRACGNPVRTEQRPAGYCCTCCR